jgi:hypothetical protein
MARMGGILGGGMGAGAGAGPVDYLEPEDEETPNVSPEEQQQYDVFVENAMQLLYSEDGEVEPEVLARLSTGKKPIDVLAQTAVWIIMIVEEDAKKNNMPIEDDVLFHAGREIVEQLIDIAEAAGIHTYKEAEIQGAWYQALDMYREANSDETGRINPDEAAGAFEALNEADKEGRADEIIPGFEQKAERAITMAMADQNEEPDESEEGETKTLNRRDRG